MVGGSSGGAGGSSLRCVTFEYSNGLTMILEDEALAEWEQNYLAGVQARAVLQLLQQQKQEEAQAEPEPAAQPSNIRTLRGVIKAQEDGQQ